MASPVAERLLTAEEYALHEDQPGTTSELLHGRLVTMPPARTGHGRRGARIDRALARFAQEHRLGETTGEGGYIVARDPDTVRGPDAAFLANSRMPPGGVPDDAYLEGAPTLAVEVI